MPMTFADAVRRAFKDDSAQFLVLGDAQHGAFSLESLANAVEAGALDPDALGLKTVLIAEVEQGEETTEKWCAPAAAKLRSKGLRVVGGETAITLSNRGAIDAALEAGDIAGFNEMNNLDLAVRVLKANTAWQDQLGMLEKNVVVCCGTSHLPAFHDNDNAGAYGDSGLVARLGTTGTCVGYAVAEPNDAPAGLYFPEWNGTGPKNFAGVTAINAHP